MFKHASMFYPIPAIVVAVLMLHWFVRPFHPPISQRERLFTLGLGVVAIVTLIAAHFVALDHFDWANAPYLAGAADGAFEAYILVELVAIGRCLVVRYGRGRAVES